MAGRWHSISALLPVIRAGFGLKSRRLDYPKSQVSPSRWPGQAPTAHHRSRLGERYRHVGAGHFSGFAVLGGNLSNRQGG
jgi:hypothetical protein